MQFELFSENWQPFATQAESTAFLRRACAKYEVLNLSYWFLGSSSRITDKLTWLSTYDEGYMAIYMRNLSPPRDPAFQRCFTRRMPLDWAEVRNSDDTVREVQHIA